MNRTRSMRRTTLGAVATLGLAAVTAALVAAPADAASVAMTLSASSGPDGGGNTLTATVSTAKFTSGDYLEFQYAASSTSACTANYATPVAVSTTNLIVSMSPIILSTTKIAFTVPSTVTHLTSSVAATTSFNICVYPGNNTSSSALLSNARYTIAAAPTVSGATLSPSSGPALGGQTITVTGGTNFITGLTATLGGVALTNVSVLSSTSFTATTPAHVAGSAALTVTTTGGTKTKTGAYTYSNGIVVSPQTTPTSTPATTLDVQGVGFNSMTWTTSDGTTPDDNNAHVYVVSGAAYDPTDDTHGAKTHGESGECVNDLVISDTELLCTLDTTHAYDQSGDGALANGVYTITVVSDGGVDVQSGGANVDANYSASIISSGSTFTVAPY